MKPKQTLTMAAIGAMVAEFQEQARALTEQEPGRARGYAEAAMALAYAFDTDAACLPRGEAFDACPACRRGPKLGALQRARAALRAWRR